MTMRSVRWMLLLPLLITLASLGGCRASYTYVLEAPAKERAISTGPGQNETATLRIVHDEKDSVDVNDELDGHFRTQLRACLQAAAKRELGEGAVMLLDDAESSMDGIREVDSHESDITLHYRVVLMEPGSSPVRLGSFLVSLFGAPVNAWGEGKVGIDVRFADRVGRTLARIVVDGPIDGPLANQRDGLELAAESIAKYAAKTVLRSSAKRPASPAS